LLFKRLRVANIEGKLVGKESGWIGRERKGKEWKS
jgi:hypothetical protein